ncbi:MAG TPA: polymer-forming cytoskeletal protein [Candidatus Doudnabacteria bacterium]|nr:polymer-forming cytoskeletal protein [Candidatus Doudnabacteria bacterium]
MAQDNSAAETVVGPSVKIQGDLNSEGNIRIEGSVLGKVNTTQSVHIGEAAVIQADMQAGNAIIAGQVQGNIKVSGNLILQATARVNGDVACAVLRVEDGALFSGKCNMKGAALDKKAAANSGEPEQEK